MLYEVCQWCCTSGIPRNRTAPLTKIVAKNRSAAIVFPSGQGVPEDVFMEQLPRAGDWNSSYVDEEAVDELDSQKSMKLEGVVPALLQMTADCRLDSAAVPIRAGQA